MERETMDHVDQDNICLPYLTMSKEELDKQYSPSQYCQRLSPSEAVDMHVATVNRASKETRQRLNGDLGVAYGSTESQKMDIFYDASTPADCPILIFIHGGYWHSMSREAYGFVAEQIVKAGGMEVAVGYDLAPEVKMAEIVRQVKNGVKLVLQMAEKRGSRGVYLCGHSAGGHLVGVMLSVDWAEEAGVDPTLIKGAIPISGVFDLRPIVDTPVNDPLHMDQEEACSHSPWLMVRDIASRCRHMQIVVSVGQHESPEFIRQSRQFDQMLRDTGLQSEFNEIEGHDHFSIVEQLAQPDYTLTKKILKMMQL